MTAKKYFFCKNTCFRKVKVLFSFIGANQTVRAEWINLAIMGWLKLFEDGVNIKGKLLSLLEGKLLLLDLHCLNSKALNRYPKIDSTR